MGAVQKEAVSRSSSGRASPVQASESVGQSGVGPCDAQRQRRPRRPRRPRRSRRASPTRVAAGSGSTCVLVLVLVQQLDLWGRPAWRGLRALTGRCLSAFAAFVKR
jgi:hypothetical protein